MSGREKIWWENRVIWIDIPDDPEDKEEPDDLWPAMMKALECLTPKQRFVIELRYGLKYQGVQMGRDQIAEAIGITPQAVQQLEDRALAKMRGLS